MKKANKILSVFLSLLMVLSIIPMANITASAYYSVSRDDGTWLFPLPSGYYSQFSDWAGCPGNGKCPFCGYVHSSWTDGDHTGQPAGHNGIDVSAPTGTSVYAPAKGSVIGASYQGSRGYIVMVKHDLGNGWAYYSYSQHLNSMSVSVGQSVLAGTVIGTVGSSGGNYGAHLHFGIVMAPSNYSFSQVLNVDYNSGSTWLKSSGYSTGRILTNPKNGYYYAGVYNAGAAVDYHRGSVTYTFDKSKVTIGSTVATTSITLNSSPFTLKIGESKTLSATVSPSNATNKTVTWSSSDTNVATVSSTGVVKAVGTGACAITSKASGGQTASVTMVVRNESLAPVAHATYNGHYYELYDDVLSWKDAKEYCESKDGHLVTITTQEENSFVQSFASNGEKEKYYIGGTDEATEGTWKWVTSETFSYINLGSGEPSPTEYEKEDYLYISKLTGQWGDIVDITGGVNSYSFICEYDDLSDIVVDQLPEGADPDDYELVTEYRSRDKQTTTSTSATLDSWTLYDSESTYGSWSSVLSTQTKPTESDTLQITGTSTQYNYFHYVNYYDGIYNIDSIPYGTSHGKHTITRSSALSKVSLADQGGKQAYGSQTCSCGFNYWFLEGTSTVYSYQTRTKTTTYHFYKWSDWTAWTETPITSTDTKQVEIRVGYRLKDENSTDKPDTPEIPDTPNIPDTEFVFSIEQPSRTTIRNKDGIVLHTVVEGELPDGARIEWSWDNNKFDVEKNDDGTLTIIARNNGETTITATVYGADGDILATDSVVMNSKSGFFDKIGGFFRSLFGATTIYEN